MPKFYNLDADPSEVYRWYLKSPVNLSGNEVDPRLFTRGKHVDTSSMSLKVPLRRQGEPIDFNFADFDMVVTPAEFNAELEKLTGSNRIQRIPVSVEGSDKGFEILNTVDLVECVDEAESEFTQWTEEDGRPDKVGQYRMFARLRINGDAAEGHHLFRVKGWPIALIASEAVKVLVEKMNLSGIKFAPVN